MIVQIEPLHTQARAPVFSSAGAACFDLHSVDSAELAPGARRAFSTGLAFAIPEGFALFLFSRSSQGANGVRLANCVGVVDSDYRGAVKVLLANDSAEVRSVRAGDRIAQGLIQRLEARPVFQIVDSLPPTERGAGGFGSTGQ